MVTHEGTFYECVAGRISWIRTQLRETPLQSCRSPQDPEQSSPLLLGTAMQPASGLPLHLLVSLCHAATQFCLAFVILYNIRNIPSSVKRKEMHFFTDGSKHHDIISCHG